MTQWYLFIDSGVRGKRRTCKARLNDYDEARILARRAGFADTVTILDQQTVLRLSRYGYGFQLLFRVAPELDPVVHGIGEKTPVPPRAA